MATSVGFSWLRWFSRAKGQKSRRAATARVRRHTFVPRLEVLEERCVPSLSPSDRGMTVYSSDTHTHWLANANLAGTINKDGTDNRFGININADGSMTFSQAEEWVYQLNTCNDGLGYLGHTNWVLPRNFAGAGFGQTTSDMGELYYNEFGCYPGESITQVKPPYFYNFQPYLYWDGQEKSPGGAQFSFGNGFQGTSIKGDVMYVIPEYSDKTQAAAEPKHVDDMKSPPKNFPPVSDSLVKSPDGKTIYDQDLGIHWLADAILAATNTFGIHQSANTSPKDPNYIEININPDGSMSYATAVAWIDAMNNYDNGRGYLGHNNWRLPMATDTSADYYITGSGIGDAFRGSEMGELYYTELGAKAGSTILLPTDSPAEGPFHHFQPYLYWAGSQTAASQAHGNGHSTFSFGSGFQGANIDTNEMYVIPVFDEPRAVTNNADDGGVGSLRSVIDAAHAGDTIDLSGLTDQVIVLQSPININLDNVGQYKTLDIEGPGAANLVISGNGSTRLFDLGSAPPEAGMTTIAGLTLADGSALEAGGAILDEGASLTLNSDLLGNNRVVTGPLTSGTARGGALAVLGPTASIIDVNITHCQFINDAAIGLFAVTSAGNAEGGAIYVDAGTFLGFKLSVTGTTFTDDFATASKGFAGGAAFPATDGGSADGGAVYVSADRAGFASFLFSSNSFTDCTALGGRGGNGAAGRSGANGGQARGGAFFYSGGRAVLPILSVTSSTFSSNSAVGGGGGTGGDARTQSANGGAGGSGGDSLGGGLFANLTSAIGGDFLLQGDTFSVNASQGGNGGAGGSGGSAAMGGAGGAGGSADGGGVAVIINSTTGVPTFSFLHSTVDANTAHGGNGGAGGAGQDGGRGGYGAGSRGAGIYLYSFGTAGAGVWMLNTVTIDANYGYSGNGGAGGDGSNVGGNGGNSKNSLGGGIYDAFAGTLDLAQCVIESNSLVDGTGGSGAHGSVIGNEGRDSISRGGGIYIHAKADAQATADTMISDNVADRRPDVFGHLGTI